jgi:transposase
VCGTGSARHVRAVIPERRDQQNRRRHRPGRPLASDRAAYGQRNVIERAVGWLKERRRIATRYEKLALQYLAMLYVGLIERYLSTSLQTRPRTPPGGRAAHR